MKPGFYTIMAAQFFSSLADNALLIAAIALLAQLAAPAWMTPLLKLFFVLSYVLLAAFVAAFADSRPKGQVMFVTNTIKIIGCAAMLFGAHPLLSYAIVGLGAAAYSPAKYGILTELLKDSVTLILPTTRSEIERALKTLKVWTLVEGFRGKSGDQQSVFRAVEAVADFANAHRGLVEELDVNPLLVLKDGAVAVDALIKMRKP